MKHHKRDDPILAALIDMDEDQEAGIGPMGCVGVSVERIDRGLRQPPPDTFREAKDKARRRFTAKLDGLTMPTHKGDM